MLTLTETNLQYLGILNLSNFSYPLSYRNSTNTEILKHKLRIEIGAVHVCYK